MSKKIEDIDWDSDDFNFDFEETKEGKFQAGRMKAGRRAIVEFAGGFVSGLKKSMLDPSNQRKLLERAAPPGFTAAFDAVSQGGRASKEIYSETKEEFLKSLGDVEEDVKTITRKYRGKMIPNRLADRLESMAEKTAKRTYAEPSEEEELATGLDGIMADVAKAQRQSMVVNKKNQQEATTQIVTTQVATTSAILTGNKILTNISRNSDILVGLNTAHAKLQRKHIELTYNQTVIQRQTLDVLQQTRELQTQAFGAIIKNTGLPEHIKATLWEAANRSFRHKLVGVATERMTSKFGDLFGTAIDRIKGNMKNRAEGAGGMLSQILGGLAMQADMGDLMGSRAERAGNTAGSIGSAILQWQLRKRLGDRYKNDPRMKMYSDNIQNLITSAPGAFNNLQDKYGMFRQLTEFLGIGDLRANDSALNVKVRGNGIRDLDQHQAYNRKSDLALTEVIPGWLGKMHHKLDIIASGDPNVAAQTFDWERGNFTSVDDLKKRTLGTMFNKQQMKDSRGQANRIVNSLDSKGELNKKDRAILMRYVIQQANSDLGYIDPAALTNPAKSPLSDIDPKAAERIAAVLSNTNNFNNPTGSLNNRGGIFSNNNKNAAYQSRMNDANTLLRDLRTALPNGMRTTIEHANVGNIDMLKELGFVSWNKDAKEWRFDQAKYLDAVMSGKVPSLPNNQGGRGNAGPPGPMNGPSGRPNPPTGPAGNGGGRSGQGNGNNSGNPPPYNPPSPNRGGSNRPNPVDVDSDGYTKFQRTLLEAIELHSAKTSVDVSNQVLEAIRQRLDLGIPTGAPAESDSEIKRKSSMFRRLLGATSRIGGKGKSFLSTIMKSQLRLASMPFRMFTGSINAAASVGNRLFRTVFNSRTPSIISSASAKFSKMMGDVYVSGRDAVAMKMSDIQAGKYFDKATGKVIKSLKDIKGAVADAAGNIVISEEDFKNGLYTLKNGKPFKIVSGIISAGLGAAQGLLRLNTLPVRALAAVGRKTLGAISALATTTKDIYVAGETSPRLLARVMQDGGYFNRNGKVIKSIWDIRGDVMDDQGNVILSVAELARGLIDKHGKPFKGVLEKIQSKVTAPFRMIRGAYNVAKTSAKSAMKFAVGAIKTPFRIGKSIYSMIKGDSSPDLKVSAHTADTVDAIYYLLNERLPRPRGNWLDRDGSGYRDGSREDILSRNRPKPKEEAKPEDRASGERRGILGMLMAMVGGIGTVIGTMRSWFGNIFGLMRMAAQTKMATSAFDMIGSLAGRGRRGRRGAGGAGGLAGFGANALAKLKSFGKSGMGRGLAVGGLAAGALLLGQSAFAQSAATGASDVLSRSESGAYDANNLEIGGSAGGSWGSMFNGGKDGELTWKDRIMNGVGGGIMGEIAAIAAFPAMAALYNKAQGTRAGRRILPGMQHGPAGGGPAPTSKMGKMMQYLTGTNKGRLLLAALTGGGFVAAKHAVTGNGGADLATEATSSFGTTLGMELLMATLLPAAIMKGKGFMDRRAAARRAAFNGPTRPVQGGSLANQRFTPTAGARPNLGANTPQMQQTLARAAQQRASQMGPQRPIQGPPVPPVPPAGGRVGLMGRAGALGKGIFANAGLLGTGLAAYDAYNTEGSLLDKGKAFGTSLLATAAIGKGLSLGGQLLTKGGRAGLMQGARTAAGFVGRQALWQGARTAAMGGLTALAGIVGAPVVLTGLAVAAGGAALYFGYQKFFGTDKAAIMRYRMAQYGVDVGDEDKVTRIAQLESIAKKHIKITGTTATFNNSMPYKEILGIFGVNQGDAEHTQRFAAWFSQRFKPVFVKGLTAYQALTKTITLEKADELDKETKLKYLNDIGSLDAAAYAILVTPFVSDKASKYDASKVKKEYDRAIEKIGHEKGKGEKSLTDKMSDSFSKNWDKIKTMANNGWDMTKTALSTAKDAVYSGGAMLAATTMKYTSKAVQWASEKGKQFGSFMGRVGTGLVDGVSNFVAKMSGSQKQWQMMVYKAFKSAGFSEQQARILTAEIGRENSYNPKYLFGGHADPHKGSNLGMLSWQGDRKPRLIAFLRSQKAIDAAGNIVQGQVGLNAQAGFIMWELTHTHKKVGSQFLANPNISYQDGAYMIGKHYILWRIDDPKYRAQGIKNRDGFYNMLLQQLGTTDGKGISKGNGDTKAGSLTATPPAIRKTANTIMGNVNASVPGMGRAPVGNGVLLPQYQRTVGATTGTPGVVGPVGAGIVVGGVPKNHRAVKAATLATQRAKPASTGYCAKFVADALQGAGYKFTRQNSAFQYASGPLASAGFTRITNNGKYQIGDVMVWPAHGQGASGGAKHGHIQIFNGRNWVSDFIQANMKPGPSYGFVVPTLWRDSTLIGKNVTGSVEAKGATPSNTPAKPTLPDGKSPDAKQPGNVNKAQVTPATTSGPVKVPPPVMARTPIQRPSQLAQQSTAATDAALTKSNENRNKATASANATQEALMREHVDISRNMLKTLIDIRDSLPKAGSAPPPTPSHSQRAMQDLQTTRNQPISMETKL